MPLEKNQLINANFTDYTGGINVSVAPQLSAIVCRITEVMLMRLIDADAICAEIEKLRDMKNMNGFELIQLDCTLTVIEHAKTIDPLKHGHWVKKNSVGSATCSICGGLITNFYDKDSNKYCHVCGAKMDAQNGDSVH